jgi:hypothetical protein
MPKLNWELVDEKYTPDAKPGGFTYRALVPGGWLVAVWAGDKQKHGQGGGLTFYPDPEHRWIVDTKDTA